MWALCKNLKVGLVIIFVPLIGCSVRNYFREKNRQINYLETSNKRIENRLSQIDSLFQNRTEAQNEFLTSMRAETIMKLGELDNRIASVESRLGDLEGVIYKKSVVQDSADTLKKQQDIYNIAYSDFNKGNYELAVIGFQQFLSQFKNVDEAYYWIGECYYAMENYTKAEESFKNVVENFPMSKKAPTALYKLISIYNITEDTLNMQENLKKLIDKYPNSPEAKLLSKTPPSKKE